MLYREIIAVCSQIHTKHVNSLCGQNVELLNVKPSGTYSNHSTVKFELETSRPNLSMIHWIFPPPILHRWIKLLCAFDVTSAVAIRTYRNTQKAPDDDAALCNVGSRQRSALYTPVLRTQGTYRPLRFPHGVSLAFTSYVRRIRKCQFHSRLQHLQWLLGFLAATRLGNRLFKNQKVGQLILVSRSNVGSWRQNF